MRREGCQAIACFQVGVNSLSLHAVVVLYLKLPGNLEAVLIELKL